MYNFYQQYITILTKIIFKVIKLNNTEFALWKTNIQNVDNYLSPQLTGHYTNNITLIIYFI